MIWTKQVVHRSRRSSAICPVAPRLPKRTHKHSANHKALSLSLSVCRVKAGRKAWLTASCLAVSPQTLKDLKPKLKELLKPCRWSHPYGGSGQCEAPRRPCVLRQHWLIGFTARPWHFDWPGDHLWDRVLAPVRVDSERVDGRLASADAFTGHIWPPVERLTACDR